MQKTKDSLKPNRGSYMDGNENLVVENSFTLSNESRESRDLWSQNQNIIKFENPNFVQRNQDTPVTASDTTNDGSDEEAGMSFSKILDSFTNVKTPERVVPKHTLVRKAPMSPHSRREIQKIEVSCEYCDEKVIYRKYRKHCMNHHPDSPWTTKTTCGTCRNSIPAVNYKFHLDLFSHEDANMEQVGEH